ncbi:hypothetical protein [Geomicrobium sp. JCM 19039]|uniref:hypothetical protein n=1 Tax=Geomicrobium sp. JCM 19039 TaxID=1460636 RepID=UPI001EE67470|nr:hypothetical protein [Geomicrobium sp. JCM 19039]
MESGQTTHFSWKLACRNGWLKTGYTRAAGYAFIGTAEREGTRLISVVMRTNSSSERFKQTEQLLEAGFSHYAKGSLLTSTND